MKATKFVGKVLTSSLPLKKGAKPVTVVKPTTKVAKAHTKLSGRYTITHDEYNGNPTIKITDTEAKNPRYGDFMFGLTKARMILDNIDAIQDFVDNNEK